MSIPFLSKKSGSFPVSETTVCPIVDNEEKERRKETQEQKKGGGEGKEDGRVRRQKRRDPKEEVAKFMFRRSRICELGVHMSTEECMEGHLEEHQGLFNIDMEIELEEQERRTIVF